jgi:undecaprenyl-diphosphatase
MQRAFSQLDIQLVALVHTLPSWLRPIMEAASFIGQPVVMGAMLSGLALTLWKRDARMEAGAAAIAILGLLISTLLKLVLHRTRPDTYAPKYFHSYSFPSGHAAATMIGFGLLAWLAAKHLPSPWSVVVPVLFGLMILLVGISRVYLGAHYPTDVLGGWVLGVLVLGVVLWNFRLL